jgi:AcrR family transcriptional regulator
VTAVKRAYGREDKEARRKVILAAATDLFRDGQGELPSVEQIAARAGLAKGTVYIYFRTKETIFSAALLEGWGSVMGLVDDAFLPAGRTKEGAVAAFLQSYGRYLDAHRELLRLDALRPTLEHNLEYETLLEFKQTLIERLMTRGEVVDRALGLTSGQGLRILMRTHALTCGLWQSCGADCTPLVTPAGALVRLDFAEELSEALTEYWRGALTGRPSKA